MKEGKTGFLMVSMLLAGALVWALWLPDLSADRNNAGASADEPLLSHEGMVEVAGASYWMGCAPNDAICFPPEKPTHAVKLSTFFVDVHETTVAEYSKCVDAGVCSLPNEGPFGEDKREYNLLREDRQTYPVNGVNWNQAQVYCCWRGKRLPTEEEFEYLLRDGQSAQVYPWDGDRNVPAGYGNYFDQSAARAFPKRADDEVMPYDDGYPGPAPVCSFARNSYGLCDISGNVMEWTASGYTYTYEDQWYADYYLKQKKVIRGGGWHSEPADLRASAREHFEPGATLFATTGFRCASSR